MDVVTGRVVDEQGAPIPYARILIDQYGEGPIEVHADDVGQYRVHDPERVWMIQGHGRTMHAEWGDRCSLAVCQVVSRVDRGVVIPDLVLLPARFGEVRTRWKDGAPAVGVHVSWFLTQRGPNRDRGPSRSIVGQTGADGRCRWGPLPRTGYSVVLRLFSPHAVAYRRFMEWASGPRDFDVELQRARVVRGCLVTAEGAPAAGHRVTIHDDNYGTPDPDMTATVDTNGEFEIGGIPESSAVLAIYAPPPPARSDDLAAVVRQWAAAFGTPTRPICHWPLPDQTDDAGTFRVSGTSR
ncbi:MAG: hypothetical protein AAGD14_01365 [Planctomycetota bacterium]